MSNPPKQAAAPAKAIQAKTTPTHSLTPGQPIGQSIGSRGFFGDAANCIRVLRRGGVEWCVWPHELLPYPTLRFSFHNSELVREYINGFRSNQQGRYSPDYHHPHTYEEQPVSARIYIQIDRTAKRGGHT